MTLNKYENKRPKKPQSPRKHVLKHAQNKVCFFYYLIRKEYMYL